MLGSTDHFYTVCKPLIDDVEHGRCVGVVSYLNIMETIHALRTKISSNKKYIESEVDPSQRETFVNNYCVEFLQIMNTLLVQKKIRIVRPNTSIGDHHYFVLNKLKRVFGQIVRNLYCDRCDRTI